MKLAIENTTFLASKGAKVVVIACGTATSQAIEELKSRFNIPIFGIIEPSVLYIDSIELDEIGVIATEGTIRSGAWERAIKVRNPNCLVINKACPMLAAVAEEGKAKSLEGRRAIKEYMKIFKERHTKNIILGCTHYPIYEAIIKEELGYEVNLINTGTAVSKYLKEYLIQNNQENKVGGSQKIFLSQYSEEFISIAKTILNEEIEIFEVSE